MSLKASAISGAKWITLSTAVSTCLQLVQLSVLSRLLSPKDFGLMAMLMVVSGFAEAYTDMGVSNAIIHRQNVTRDQLSSLYWLNVLAGMAIFLTLLLLTPLVAAFYKEPRLSNLMPWVISVFLISPISQQPQILLQKELRFKVVALIEIAARIAGFCMALTCALKGFGVYALIWGSLVSSVVGSLAVLAAGWSLCRPRLHFRWSDTRSFVGFGLYQMGERSINYFNTNVDKLLIGRLLGADALGYYNLAWNLVIMPVYRINPILTRIAFPVFAKMQAETKTLKRGFFKILQVLSMIDSAVLCGIASVAQVMIPTVFGQNWRPAIGLVQILAFVSLLRGVINPMGSLLLAKGRADLAFKWNLALLSFQLVGVYLGASLGGVYGLAGTLLVLHVAYFFLAYRFIITPLIGPCWKEYQHAILPSFLVSFSMGLLVWTFLRVFSQTSIDPRLLLAGGVGLGIVYFLVVGMATRRAEFLEFARLSGIVKATSFSDVKPAQSSP